MNLIDLLWWTLEGRPWIRRFCSKVHLRAQRFSRRLFRTKAEQGKFNCWKVFRHMCEELGVLRGEVGEQPLNSLVITLTSKKCLTLDPSTSFDMMSWLPLSEFRYLTMFSSAVPRIASVLTRIWYQVITNHQTSWTNSLTHQWQGVSVQGGVSAVELSQDRGQ